MILCHGNNTFGYLMLAIFLLLQIGTCLKTRELQYDIQKNQKEYSIVLNELEEKNNLILKGE